MSYRYRDTYRGPKSLAADVVAQELARLQEDSDLTASRVLAAARPEGAVLHAAFEWDDGVAGHEYRLIQARSLIRAVVQVSDRGEDEGRAPQSIYVHVPDRGEGKYTLLSAVVETPDEYERALTEARRYLDSAENRFHELRRVAEGKGGKAEALAIAMQGFAAVHEALTILQAA